MSRASFTAQSHGDNAMLSPGNSKLGRRIFQWSIPAGKTCPSKSKLCDSRCYAQKGYYHMESVKSKLEENLKKTADKLFVRAMIDDVVAKKATVVRIHVAGDFYSTEYVRKWHSVVAATPNVVYFTYTRSWRDAGMKAALFTMAKDCKNLRMWWSADAETGHPAMVPGNIRVAYMSVLPEDVPDYRAALVFRDYGVRKDVVKRMNGVLVCPAENGATEITCQQCKYCFRDPAAQVKKFGTAGGAARRTSLTVVT
jgi:Gene product 88